MYVDNVAAVKMANNAYLTILVKSKPAWYPCIIHIKDVHVMLGFVDLATIK